MNSFSEYVSITRVWITVATILIATSIAADESSDVIEWEQADDGSQVAKFENWMIKKEVDLLTDLENVVLVKEAVKGEAGMFIKKPVVLILMCQERQLLVGINWIQNLGISFDFDNPDADETHSVTHRVLPGGTTTENVWGRNDETTVLGGLKARNLLSQMLEASSQPDSKFVASVKPLDEGAITGIWELEGLETAIKPLRKQCPY